jgi:precorrin-2 dehydrogenase/sirohydrochlorin ferrochelatase
MGIFVLPIILRSDIVRIGLAGAGEGLRRRQELLKNSGVTARVFENRIPPAEELADLSVLFVAGLDRDLAAKLASAARAGGILVNVEDEPELCDFHVPAAVRRGDLLMTVSTGGRAPGLARALRADLESRFGPEWDDRVNQVAALRSGWRGDGAAPQDVSERTQAYLAEKGWLS